MGARIEVTFDELWMLKAQARGFSLQARQPISSLLAGRHASRLRGRGLAFEELRQYREGDDVRTIDWKATARLRSPQVRVYSEERERPVLFVVDQRAPMFFGSRSKMKSVAAAEVMALGAWRTLESGDRVGGIVFNEAEAVEVRPHRSRTRLLQLFHETIRMNRQLTEREPVSGDVDLNAALRQALNVAHHSHLVVVISDLDGANEETEKLATQLVAHNDVLIVAVYDPLGAVLSGSPGMMASDRGQVWEIPAGKQFSERFQKAFQERLDQWTTLFHNLRVPVLPISTAYPVDEQIRSILGDRPTAS
ncbi:DUF58 domain-containing protein [Blastopirellula sp. JC732]|uniref:DUF58 domain-containing protein n=1 Tax=Blastopirellula sediminis TaxID=2894196 RepID=A0A9X1MKW1_9BACT|nr:DUF58 domain-containing protein [Blastopirellula sediminis]MCC9609051.1 DUF58 domain-containing protein [Blastopirellula sediminis]MCC9628172.1 DUF58 domain-containing protein [Blastopirellula sediminis]